MSSFARVLLATDFSDQARAANAWAAKMAKSDGGTVVLVHAPEGDLVAAASSLAGYIQEEALDLGRYREEFRRGAERALAVAAAEVEAMGVPVEAHLLSNRARPWEAIVRAADELHCDVIVLASRGRGALAKLWIGTTAEKVVRMANCPVMTVHLGDLVALKSPSESSSARG